jgi:L-iditol 2-dehydrogenase
VTVDKMRAAVFHGPGRLDVETVPVPEIGPDEILVKTGANTLCGTDLRILRGEKTRGVRRPSILGHEFSGSVAAVGRDVKDFAPGSAVAMAPVVPCLRCVHCKHDRENVCANRRAMGYEYDGALAEYVRIPAEALAAGNVFAVAEPVPFAQLALAEPLACCLNGSRRSGITLGDTVVILGAGPIGLLHAQLARRAGAAEVIVSEVSEARRETAGELGATRVVSPAELSGTVEELTHGVGADATIICIGLPQLVNDAIGVTRKGGTINIFAGLSGEGWANVAANEIHYRELVVTGTSAMRRRDYEQALRLIVDGSVDVAKLITHEVPLSRAPEAFDLAAGGSGLKVAVVP